MKNNLAWIIVLFFIVYSSVSFAAIEPLGQKVTVTTDSTNYFLNDYGALVRFTIHNASDSVAVFVTCAGQVGFFLDANENGLWVEKAAPACLAIYPIYDTTIVKDSSYRSYTWIDHPGTYRMNFPQKLDQTHRDSIISNEFSVQYAAQTRITLIEDDQPTAFWLGQNYPNPFNPTTEVRFSIPKTSIVHLEVFDMLGRSVLTVFHEEKSKGIYQLTLTAGAFSSGTYLLSLRAGDYTQTQKIILTK
jgi:hypothetical protein